MPTVLKQTLADKSFISTVAKKALQAIVQSCPSYNSCQVLIEGSKSKSLVLAEFSVTQLALLVKCADSHFFQNSDPLINAMCFLIEGKKTRMVKNAVPVLQEIRSHLGKEGLYEKAVLIFSSEVGPEEQKDDKTTAQKEIQLRVERIMAVIDPPAKKVDKSKDFRSFIKAQSTDTQKSQSNSVLL